MCSCIGYKETLVNARERKYCIQRPLKLTEHNPEGPYITTALPLWEDTRLSPQCILKVDCAFARSSQKRTKEKNEEAKTWMEIGRRKSGHLVNLKRAWRNASELGTKDKSGDGRGLALEGSLRVVREKGRPCQRASMPPCLHASSA